MITPEQQAVRDQVIGAMVKVARDATAAGLDAWKAIETTFLGTPADVIADAWVKAGDEDSAEWWAMVEKTFDVAMVQRAIAEAGK